MRIGILEDDLTQQELYKLWLGTANHDCLIHGTAADFTTALQLERFDMLIVDWEIPDSSGEIVLRWVRDNLGWEMPVLFVTSRDSEKDIVTALRAGADDYVVKPAKCLELLARIESLGRRITAPAVQQIGAYQINKDLREIRVNGELIELTQKEFELACYLFENHSKLLSRVHLLEKLWGLSADIDTRTVDTHVSRVRRKLSISPENGWKIIPIYGYGYRIEKSAAEAA